MWLAALVYTAFVIYGSLVPLEFRAIPWDEAVARFTRDPFLELGIGSRADWVANLLLFIPLTYPVDGRARGAAQVGAHVLARLLLIPVAIALSVGIEFTQLFFPQRTVSQNDIFAETWAASSACWSGGGRRTRFLDWLQAGSRPCPRCPRRASGLGLSRGRAGSTTCCRSTSPSAWSRFSISGGRQAQPDSVRPPAGRCRLRTVRIATDALIWTPLALLWRLDGTRSAWRVWGMTLGPRLLEAMQLFVYSRVSDVTDLFTAAAGAALGCLDRRAPGRARGAAPAPAVVGLAAVRAGGGWAGAADACSGFPLISRDGAFIKNRLDFVQRVPFEVYYFGTEFRADHRSVAQGAVLRAARRPAGVGRDAPAVALARAVVCAGDAGAGGCARGDRRRATDAAAQDRRPHRLAAGLAGRSGGLCRGAAHAARSARAGPRCDRNGRFADQC
jgi:VanZ family protein